jgi:DNA-binding NarL/FixJ family response regulator
MEVQFYMQSIQPIRVLLVDDDPFIRESLNMILNLDPNLQVEGVCKHGQEAFEWLEANTPVDVVLMDIRMPVCDGVEGTRRIKLHFPDTKVLILTTFDDDEYILEALKHGASGYLLKNVAPQQIKDSIHSVHQGNWFIHPAAAKKLSGWLFQPNGAKPKMESKPTLSDFGLTATEQTVVIKIADGKSNKEIAQECFLSEGTVKNYISEILSKLALRDRTQIAIFYLKDIDH